MLSTIVRVKKETESVMTRLRCLTILLVSVLCCATFGCAELKSSKADAVRVMTFNIWVNGEAGGQPVAQTAEVIKQAKADIVGLQEASPETAKVLAELLDWNYSPNQHNVLTRFDIAETNAMGIKVRLDNDKEAYVFSVHLHHAP